MYGRLKQVLRRMFPKFYSFLGRTKYFFQLENFKRKYPETKIFKPRDQAPGFFSQEGQDFILNEHFFKDKVDGVFCDVGGNHPIKFNNTYFFEKCGWSGYVFEPLPMMKELWQKHRNAKLFPYAVSDRAGDVVFTVVENELSATDMFSYVKETGGMERDFKSKDIVVKTRPLKDVFIEEGVSDIDYMSIDVEGHEINVLKGIDFNNLNVSVLTVENNTPPYYVHGNDEIRRILFENDYILWGRIVGLDDIYVKKHV